jgi:peptide/nickel transport system permease protein
VAGFVIRRLLWAVMLVVIISWFTFVLFFVVPRERRERVRGSGFTSIAAQFRVDEKPVPAAYAHFLWAVVRHGELGDSYFYRQPVRHILADAVPVTAGLAIGGSLLWILIAFPVGVLSALRPRSLLDRLGMVFLLIGVSAHPVWIGLMLSYFFGLKWHVTPVGGYCEFFSPVGTCGGAADWAYHMVLPWITFACLFAALYARMVRATVLEALDEDYVRTATAKGAPRRRVLRVHALRNALLPVVTMMGMDVGLAFGGVVFVETAFGLPGVGMTMAEALEQRDLPVIMGVVLVVSVAVVVANLVVDLLYPLLDPRVRFIARGDAPRRRPRFSVPGQAPPGVTGSTRYPKPARSADGVALPRPPPAPVHSRTGWR